MRVRKERKKFKPCDGRACRHEVLGIDPGILQYCELVSAIARGIFFPLSSQAGVDTGDVHVSDERRTNTY
jgi:hypothetical protein